jgi:hypothetical protein
MRWNLDHASGPSRPHNQRPASVELDDRGDDAVDADRHQHGDANHHGDARRERRLGHEPERDHDDLGGQDEIRADRALDLLLLDRHEVDGGIGKALEQHPFPGLVLVPVQEAMSDLFEALVGEISAADHQQRRDRPRHDRADRERGRHEDRVDRRAFATAHDRQLAPALRRRPDAH